MAHLDTSRRLATILAADVVGYSRLMAQDEEATVRTLKAHREIIDRLIARHEGRIFNTAGDSVLAEFGSAVEAVRCAITIQDELRVRNAELVEARQMLFRIGVNIGDVITDGDDLLGDGINVAARLEGIAPAGGVCISGSTFEQVKNKLSIGFEALGLQAVKNIPDPVAAFRLTTAPVSVSDATEPGDSVSSATTRLSRRTGLILAILLGLGALTAWLLYERESPLPTTTSAIEPATDTGQPVPPKEVTVRQQETLSTKPEATRPQRQAPEAVSTTDLSASAITDMMAGVSIRGSRQKDGQPFIIVLHDDMTASYAYPRTGPGTGTTFRATGRWWGENGQFCMKFRGFNNGKVACPRITRTDSKLTASRPDGAPLAWTVSRSVAGSAFMIPPGEATSTDEMRAAEIAALMAGMTIHGSRRKDGRPFTIALERDGTANVEVERPGGENYQEAGKWWSEDFRFCMRFKKYNNGQRSCPRIVRQGERLAMTRGDGSPLPWSVRR